VTRLNSSLGNMSNVVYDLSGHDVYKAEDEFEAQSGTTPSPFNGNRELMKTFSGALVNGRIAEGDAQEDEVSTDKDSSDEEDTNHRLHALRQAMSDTSYRRYDSPKHAHNGCKSGCCVM